MQIFLFQICPRCEKIIIESGRLCQSCRNQVSKNKDFFLDALVVSAKYKENNISKIIHTYKYNLVQDLYIPLGKIMIKALLDSNLPLSDVIIPIPLHKRRIRWRGFNQASHLAIYVSKNLTPGLEIPVLNDLLFRKNYTTPQMKIKKYAERKMNIRDAFDINPYGTDNNCAIQISRIKNKRILLVDDIATTGATLNECARILKSAGAKKVFGIVLARQEFRRK